MGTEGLTAALLSLLEWTEWVVVSFPEMGIPGGGTTSEIPVRCPGGHAKRAGGLRVGSEDGRGRTGASRCRLAGPLHVVGT